VLGRVAVEEDVFGGTAQREQQRQPKPRPAGQTTPRALGRNDTFHEPLTAALDKETDEVAKIAMHYALAVLEGVRGEVISAAN
jgi:hypothetical protein